MIVRNGRRLLSRTEVANRFGCTSANVFRLQKAGCLEVIHRVTRGKNRPAMVYYDAQAVADFWDKYKEKQRKSSVAARRLVGIDPEAARLRAVHAKRAFELFEQGVPWREAVKILEADPVIVRQLLEEWEMPPHEKKRREALAEQKRIEADRQRDYDRNRWAEEQRAHELKLAKLGVKVIGRRARIDVVEVSEAAEGGKST